MVKAVNGWEFNNVAGCPGPPNLCFLVLTVICRNKLLLIGIFRNMNAGIHPFEDFGARRMQDPTIGANRHRLYQALRKTGLCRAA